MWHKFRSIERSQAFPRYVFRRSRICSFCLVLALVMNLISDERHWRCVGFDCTLLKCVSWIISAARQYVHCFLSFFCLHECLIFLMFIDDLCSSGMWCEWAWLWCVSIDGWQNESKPVQMMSQKAKFPLAFIPDVNCQILELPYAGKDLSMLIMLPNTMEDNTTGLQKVR